MGRRAWGQLLAAFAVLIALVCGPVLIAAGEDAVDGAGIASIDESSALAVEGEGSTEAAEDSAEASNAVSSNEYAAYSWRYEAGELESQTGDSDVMLLSRPTLPEGAAEWGVDVSFAQGDIDWAKAKADGVDFAILRLGYGAGGSDRRFTANVQGCKANGIKFGVYLYSYAWNASTATSEAEWTLTVLRNAGASPSDLGLPVYYDLENQNPATGRPAGVDDKNQYHEIEGGSATFAAMGKAFCSKIAAAGYTPGVYANLRWWNNFLTDSVFDNWDRWVAQYNATCEYEGDYTLWQYSSSGSVDGISGRVDVNYLYDPEGTPQYMDKLASANKGLVQDGSYVVALAAGNRQVLDVSGGSLYAGANVQSYGANASAAQTWVVQTVDGGYLKISNLASGKVLSVTPSSSQAGANVQQEDWKDTRSQKWVAIKQGAGIVLRSALGKHLVLDVPQGARNGSNVVVNEDASSSSQAFVLYSADGSSTQSRTLPDGTYSFTLNGLSLDIAGASTANGAALQLFTSNGTAAQLFSVSFHEISGGKGYYTMRPAHSQKLLDADNGACYPGASVAQWGDAAGAKQRYWVIE